MKRRDILPSAFRARVGCRFWRTGDLREHRPCGRCDQCEELGRVVDLRRWRIRTEGRR